MPRHLGNRAMAELSGEGKGVGMVRVKSLGSRIRNCNWLQINIKCISLALFFSPLPTGEVLVYKFEECDRKSYFVIDHVLSPPQAHKGKLESFNTTGVPTPV